MLDDKKGQDVCELQIRFAAEQKHPARFTQTERQKNVEQGAFPQGQESRIRAMTAVGMKFF